MNITKEEALAKIEELKKYVGEVDKKAEEKVVGLAIKTWSGSLIFQSTKTTWKEAIQERLASGANLSDANLSDANLSDADLSDANLSDANLRGAELQNAKFIGRVSSPKALKQSQLKDFLWALGFRIEE